jgi:uncharacterized RDD family membrane protein YckC
MADDSDVVLGRHPDASGTTRQRRGAGLYDLLVVGWAIGMLAVPLREVAPLLSDGSFFWLWTVLVLVEGTTGASPGKHVTGLRIERLDGGRVGLATAVRRRPWGWLLPLQFVGAMPNAIATAAALGTLLVMLVSIERSDDRRGFHDRLAGTVVVAGDFSPTARLVVVGVTLAAAIAGLLLGTQVTPLTPA